MVRQRSGLLMVSNGDSQETEAAFADGSSSVRDYLLIHKFGDLAHERDGHYFYLAGLKRREGT